MKNLFLLFFSILALNLSAQTATKQNITFGGIESGGATSIMQLRDYPALLSTDKATKIISYTFTLTLNDSYEANTFNVIGASLSKEAMDLLQNSSNKSGSISISNIKTQKGEVTFETPYNLELTFNQ